MTYQEALDILGLTGAPSAQEAKEAYRRKVLASHPDHDPTSAVLASQLGAWRHARDILFSQADAEKPCKVCKGVGIVVLGLNRRTCVVCHGSGERH